MPPILRTSLLLLILAPVGLFGEEIQDVIFYTPHARSPKETPEFYYNGIAIDRGQPGFQAIVERVAKLPAGTSIIWGPNYTRSNTDRMPDSIAEALYPNLWRELRTAVSTRNLSLSSDYPGPWLRPVPTANRARLPDIVAPDEVDLKRRFDAVLDWEIGQRNQVGEEPEGTVAYATTLQNGFVRRSHRFSINGKSMTEYERNQWLSNLAVNTKLGVRIKFSEKLDPEAAMDQPSAIANEIREIWEDRRLGQLVRLRKLSATIITSAELGEKLKLAARQLSLTWNNYHGTATPHDEVLYEVNDEYVGRGDAGFERILKKMNELPHGAEVSLPRYEYSSRFANSVLGSDGVERRNAALKAVVPFADRRKEFDAIVGARKLGIFHRSLAPPLPSANEPKTVVNWKSGDLWAAKILTYGRIVRHDEKRGPAAVVVGWKGYATHRDVDAPGGPAQRLPESTAAYTFNEEALGRGLPAFSKAMDRLVKLPAGSVVQVHVCLRTKGPFLYPLVYENQRHFERTGFEPYVGMFPWLIDVAQKNKLKIEWLPDEGKSCEDCELNK